MKKKDDNNYLNKEQQTFEKHFLELRKRIIFSIIIFTANFLIIYFFSEKIFNILIHPLSEILSQKNEEKRIIYTNLTEAFTAHVKISFITAIVISLPFLLHQIWSFIAPGLYKKEKKNLWIIFITSPILFLIGIAFSYFIIMPLAWSFFASFENTKNLELPIELEAKIGEYLTLSIQLIVAFGIAFQLPIIIIMLNKMKIVTNLMLRKYRKYAFLIMLIVSAILTPPDVLSQIGLTIPLYFLYEISIYITSDKKEKQ